ncbi:MFS transporter [Nocardioides sp. BP30]|uniref:MFS transporter n=1 Tax=Nocardioides sp. BP30 TaxID=3036374 RepID=UPI002469C410|nr:MFS transporter [Nocardioides sp. BP30]WGL51747.1 MFS transporter [Nocardioides sp. BP30]
MSIVALERSGVLRHREFRLLAGGSAVSSFGNAITPVALAFAVLDLGGSAAELGLVEAAFSAAEVLTTLLGGVLGDRVSRRLMMQGSSMGSASIQAVLALTLVLHHASIGGLTALGMIAGVLSALSGPASKAVTRMTVPEADLAGAVATRALLQQLAMTIGYAVGGILVAAVDAGWAIMIDAATFGVAAVCFSRLRIPDLAAGPRGTVVAELGEGAREVLRHAWLWLLIGQALLYHFFFGGAQNVLGPIVVGEGMGRAAWGAALAWLMVGFVVGGLICLRWRPRRSLFIGTMLLATTALFPLAMALAPTPPLVWAGAFLHGVGLSIFSVFWDLAIQQNVADDKLSRVYAFDLVGSFVARPLGLALTGPVAEAVGFERWLVVVAAVIGGSSLLTLLSGDVRRLELRR